MGKNPQIPQHMGRSDVVRASSKNVVISVLTAFCIQMTRAPTTPSCCWLWQHREIARRWSLISALFFRGLRLTWYYRYQGKFLMNKLVKALLIKSYWSGNASFLSFVWNNWSLVTFVWNMVEQQSLCQVHFSIQAMWPNFRSAVFCSDGSLCEATNRVS